ncbi:MAG: hypothetical protein FJY53_03080 [Betaproteobacteria bacterium]|nr:hypothetical protein [Betaproteobacteria bacterium]
MTLFLSGLQALASDEKKNSKKPEFARIAEPSGKAKPNGQANSKAKASPIKRDTAKMPVDPLEKRRECAAKKT